MKKQTKIPNLRHGWHLIGAGPARFGWAWAHPCSLQWLGKTKREAVEQAAKLGLIA